MSSLLPEADLRGNASLKRNHSQAMKPANNNHVMIKRQMEDASIQSFIHFLTSEEKQRNEEKAQYEAKWKRRKDEEKMRKKKSADELILRGGMEDEEEKRKILAEERIQRDRERKEWKRIRDKERRKRNREEKEKEKKRQEEGLDEFREARRIVHSMIDDSKDRIVDTERKHEDLFMKAYTAVLRGESVEKTVEEIKSMLSVRYVQVQKEPSSDLRVKEPQHELERLQKGRAMVMNRLEESGIKVDIDWFTSVEKENLYVFTQAYFFLLKGQSGEPMIGQITSFFKEFRQVDEDEHFTPLLKNVQFAMADDVQSNEEENQRTTIQQNDYVSNWHDYPTPPPSNLSAQSDAPVNFGVSSPLLEPSLLPHTAIPSRVAPKRRLPEDSADIHHNGTHSSMTDPLLPGAYYNDDNYLLNDVSATPLRGATDHMNSGGPYLNSSVYSYQHHNPLINQYNQVTSQLPLSLDPLPYSTSFPDYTSHDPMLTHLEVGTGDDWIGPPAPHSPLFDDLFENLASTLPREESAPAEFNRFNLNDYDY